MDHPFDDLEEAEDRWIPPYGTVAAEDTLRDEFGNYKEPDHIPTGESTIYESSSPEESQEPSRPQGENVEQSLDLLSLGEKANEHLESPVLNQHPQNPYSATTFAFEHILNESRLLGNYRQNPYHGATAFSPQYGSHVLGQYNHSPYLSATADSSPYILNDSLVNQYRQNPYYNATAFSSQHGSDFLGQYHHSPYRSATAHSSQHVLDIPNTRMEAYVDPVLFVYDKLASQSNLTSDATKSFLEHQCGPLNTQGNPVLSEQQKKQVLEMLKPRMVDVPPSLPTRTGNIDNSGELTPEELGKEPGPVTNNDMIISPLDAHASLHQPDSVLVRPVSSLRSLQSEILSYQKADGTLAKESLNADALNALPTTEEIDLKSQGYNIVAGKEMEPRMSAHRPYPHVSAERHGYQVASIGLPNHYTKPKHSERAILQASSISAPIWREVADPSAVLCDQESLKSSIEVELKPNGNKSRNERLETWGGDEENTREETQDLGHGLEDADDLRTLFPSLYDDLVNLKAKDNAGYSPSQATTKNPAHGLKDLNLLDEISQDDELCHLGDISIDEEF